MRDCGHTLRLFIIIIVMCFVHFLNGAMEGWISTCWEDEESRRRGAAGVIKICRCLHTEAIQKMVVFTEGWPAGCRLQGCLDVYEPRLPHSDEGEGEINWSAASL